MSKVATTAIQYPKVSKYDDLSFADALAKYKKKSEYIQDNGVKIHALENVLLAKIEKNPQKYTVGQIRDLYDAAVITEHEKGTDERFEKKLLQLFADKNVKVDDKLKPIVTAVNVVKMTGSVSPLSTVTDISKSLDKESAEFKRNVDGLRNSNMASIFGDKQDRGDLATGLSESYPVITSMLAHAQENDYVSQFIKDKENRDLTQKQYKELEVLRSQTHEYVKSNVKTAADLENPEVQQTLNTLTSGILTFTREALVSEGGIASTIPKTLKERNVANVDKFLEGNKIKDLAREIHVDSKLLGGQGDSGRSSVVTTPNRSRSSSIGEGPC